MSARPGPCGGHQATGVPTAINEYRLCRRANMSAVPTESLARDKHAG